MKLIVPLVYIGIVMGYMIPVFSTAPGIFSFPRAVGVAGAIENIDKTDHTVLIHTFPTGTTPEAHILTHYDEHTVWLKNTQQVINGVIISSISSPETPNLITTGTPVATQSYVTNFGVVYAGVINVLAP